MSTKVILSVNLSNGATVWVPHIASLSPVMEAENKETGDKGFLYQIHLVGGVTYAIPNKNKDALLRSRQQLVETVNLYWRSHGYIETQNNGIILPDKKII